MNKRIISRRRGLKSGMTAVILACCFLNMIEGTAQEKLCHDQFSLGDVRLLDGPFKHARDLNINVLLQYQVDRLLAGYRNQAGLEPKDSIYRNWDGLDGHVGGHYLSAMAMNYASTKNAACKERMEYMIAELGACQDANAKNHPDWGAGYVGAVPNSEKIWSNLRKGDFGAYRSAWVPWYNVHKMYAGLRDAWVYAGNEQAKMIFLKFCDWAINITASLSADQMQSMLDTEHGGMNEVLADAYQISGEEKYLVAARRFSHRMLLDAMAEQKDNLDNKHANTQVPKAVGFARIGELGNDASYGQAGRFFWETVTMKRTLAFGGNSRREFFPSAAACSDFVNDVEGPESCNTYNMLKLTENLFGRDPSVNYVDFYEKALYNHILSTQHPGHGGYVYFTPARPRHYRVYSAPNEGMWCCVGSGMENHGKYNQFIYARRNDSLFVNLFIASELTWKDKGIRIKQETSFPYESQTSLRIVEGSSRFKMMVRYPGWVRPGALRVTINGKPFSYKGAPSSFIMLDRVWKKGDVIRLILPMHLSVEQTPNVPDYIAFMYGPVLLAARTGTEDLRGIVADGGRWAHIAGGRRLPVDKAPIILEDDVPAALNKLKPVPGKRLTFTASALKVLNPVNMELEPFFNIHDARYMMYWMTLNNSRYSTYLDSIASAEKEKLALAQRTVDFVAPGEQQPEADHDLEKSNSNTGNHLDEFWRDARSGGYFSYRLATRGETDLALWVRYWGAEWGNRKFDIYVDDEKLASVDNTGKWNQSRFQQEEYPIPGSMLRGKQHIRIRFQALPGSTAGAVYYIRLIKKKTN